MIHLPASADAMSGAADPDRIRANQAAEKFESLFILEMLRHMRSATRELSGPQGAEHDRAGEELRDHADLLVADALAGRHAFGIADMLLRSLHPDLKPQAAPVAPVK
jgi:flagellar protein FlgJ